MATSWITGMVTNAIAPTIHSTVSQAGGIAGDIITGVGNSINGVGSSINSTISGYGNGVNEYGNAVKDWTQAEGPRSGTARNPLGLVDTWTGGKHVLGYGQGAKKDPPKKKPGAPQQKALPAPKPTPAVKPSPSAARNAPSVPKTNGASSSQKPQQHATKPSEVNTPKMMSKRAEVMRRKRALEQSASQPTAPAKTKVGIKAPK